MPKFWKVILGFLGFIVGIIIILMITVLFTGGSLSEVFFNANNSDIEHIEEKKEFIEGAIGSYVDDSTVYPEDLNTVFSTFIVETPSEPVDGMFILYAPDGKKSFTARDSIPRYLQQEDAYEVNVFYMANADSALAAQEYYSRLTGEDFGDAPSVFIVEDGEVVYRGTFFANVSEYPLKGDDLIDYD